MRKVSGSNGNIVLEKMLRVSWTEKIIVKILNTANSRRKLMSKAKKRRAECLGLVTRKGKLDTYLHVGI